jgi:hypothetical protein
MRKKTFYVMSILFLFCFSLVYASGTVVTAGNSKMALQIQLAQTINTLGFTNDQLSRISLEVSEYMQKANDLVLRVKAESEKVLSLYIQRKSSEVSRSSTYSTLLKENQALMAEYVSKVRAILTTEQLQKLDQTLLGAAQNPPNGPGSSNQQMQPPQPPQGQGTMGNFGAGNPSTGMMNQQGNNAGMQTMQPPQSTTVGLNLFCNTLLSDWAIELLDRFVSGK